MAGALVGGAIMLPHRPAPASHSRAVAGITSQRGVLLATTRHDDPSQQADSLTLFVSDPDARAPFALFLPVGTLAPIPAQGFDSIGKALTFGDAELQRLTVENLLGVRIERSVVIDDAMMPAIIGALGGIDVDVQEQLYVTNRDGSRSLVFPMGRNHLDAARATRYLTMDAGTELDRFVRAHKVFEAIFAKGAQVLTGALNALSPVDAEVLGAVWKLFAGATVERSYEVLPVESVGAGPDEVYRPDASKIDDMVMRDLAPSLALSGTAPSARPRIELRNGNGRPGAGERAAARLIPAGFHIEVTGNAASFGNRETRIVVYGDDAALGARIRTVLGIGKVMAATQGQTVVDATVVIGEDFQQEG